MVAVPVLSTAVGQRFSILGGTGTGTKMEASIHLRAKDFAAHERWLANLADVITSNGLDDLWENQKLPTREAVARQFTNKTSEEQQDLLARAIQQWQSENTRLYFLVKVCVYAHSARSTLGDALDTVPNLVDSALACVSYD
jgi:hypothetical protein